MFKDYELQAIVDHYKFDNGDKIDNNMTRGLKVNINYEMSRIRETVHEINMLNNLTTLFSDDSNVTTTELKLLNAMGLRNNGFTIPVNCVVTESNQSIISNIVSGTFSNNSKSLFDRFMELLSNLGKLVKSVFKKVKRGLRHIKFKFNKQDINQRVELIISKLRESNLTVIENFPPNVIATLTRDGVLYSENPSKFEDDLESLLDMDKLTNVKIGSYGFIDIRSESILDERVLDNHRDLLEAEILKPHGDVEIPAFDKSLSEVIEEYVNGIYRLTAGIRTQIFTYKSTKTSVQVSPKSLTDMVLMYQDISDDVLDDCMDSMDDVRDIIDDLMDYKHYVNLNVDLINKLTPIIGATVRGYMSYSIAILESVVFTLEQDVNDNVNLFLDHVNLELTKHLNG